MKKNEIKELLNSIVISQEAQGEGEDIMTFNGCPIGSTITGKKSLQIDRWWPALKEELTSVLYERFESKDNKIQSINCVIDAMLQIPCVDEYIRQLEKRLNMANKKLLEIGKNEE